MIFAFALLLVALLAFANGSNDVSKGVATLVGSGVTDYRRALQWGTVWTVLGALLGGVLAVPLAERFARSLGSEAGRHPAIPIAVILASLAWVAFSSCLRLPVSTTHAIAGSILGAGWIGEGLSPLTRSDVLKGFFLPLLASPVMALALTFVLSPAVRRLGRWLDARCLCAVSSIHHLRVGNGADVAAPSSTSWVVGRAEQCAGRASWSWNLSLDQAHWLSSGLVSLSRGLNDAPKIWALTLPLFFTTGPHRGVWMTATVTTVALAMGLGSWRAGRRVTEVLAERVTPMDHDQGFSANLATALLVVVASRLGLPVSTTHVSAGAIVGTGLAGGRRAVNWRLLGEMAFAWAVTLPVAGLVAMVCTWLFV